MLKKWSVLFGVILMVGTSFAEEGRWSLSTDKKTGKDVALLQTWSKRVMKVLPLAPVREYSPVPYDEILDKKQKKRAMRRGYKFTRLTAKNTSATPIDGGQWLVLQEQTIVMPPQPEVLAGDPLEIKEGVVLEPEDNSILVTLFDESGKALWSRKYGPLAGHLPANRKAWLLPPLLEEGPKVDPPPSQK